MSFSKLHITRNGLLSSFCPSLRSAYEKSKKKELALVKPNDPSNCCSRDTVTNLSTNSKNEMFPSLNNQSAIQSFLKNVHGISIVEESRNSSKKRTRDDSRNGPNISKDTKDSGGDNHNSGNFVHENQTITRVQSPVELVEEIFFVLSIISMEYANFEDHQVDMLMNIICACIRNMFKEAMLENWEYLKETFKVNALREILKDVILIARRRGGKTTIICAALTAIILVLSDQNILFFSTGGRISFMGRDLILDMLQMVKNSSITSKYSNVTFKTSKESLVVWNGKSSTPNKAIFYPSDAEVCTSFFFCSTYFTKISHPRAQI